MLAEVKPAGIWKTEHIIYFVIFTVLLALGIFLVYRFAKSDKAKRLTLIISSIVLFIMIFLNRFFMCYYGIVLGRKTSDYTWWRLIPDSLCGLTSFLLPFFVIFGKKNNIALHYLFYLSMYGGIYTLFYPEFLSRQEFFDPRSIFGMLHHSVSMWVSLVLIITGYFKPTMKKWHIFPLGYMIYIVFGQFERTILGFDDSMNIVDPVIKSMYGLTNWFTYGLLLSLSVIIFLFIYSRVKYKQGFVVTLKQMAFWKKDNDVECINENNELDNKNK